MATRMRGRVGKITRRGHRAHTSMGLPRGNPLAKGGNFGRRVRRAGSARVFRAGRRY
jgi:hypothetical protein